MISSYQTTKRAASFFVALFLVINLMMGAICPVHAAETEDPITIDKYAFVETICGMYNCFYIPEKVAQSDLSTWQDIVTYDGSFEFILKILSGYYASYARDYNVDDPTAEDYCIPYLYYDASGVDLEDVSIYNQFVTDGCLDFTNSLGENEYKVLQLAFNKFFKLMYDYNYNLLNYSISDLSASVPHIALAGSYGNVAYNWYIGYNFPMYTYDTSCTTCARGSEASITAAELFISDYSTMGFNINDYVAVFETGSDSNYSTAEVLNFALISNYSVGTSLSDITYTQGPGTSSSLRVHTISAPCTLHQFTGSGSASAGYSTSCTATTVKETSYTRSLQYSRLAYVSPLLGYYECFGSKIHNWGQDLVVGSSEAWKTYCSFDGTPQGIYNVPTESTLNSIIQGMVAKDETVYIYVDSFTGINTGSDVIDTEQDPEFDYDRIEDKIDGAVDSIINGGNYSDGNSAHSDLENSLNDYENAENQLQDFTNLDNAVETFWNTNNLLDNATNISTVSTYFMTIWDSFGPFGICFSLAIALGLAAFLLKI